MRTVKSPEIRQEEIMNAAEKLFRQRSVDKTSVNDIVLAAGVAKGTFYWYFKSKEDLVEALVAREIDRYVERINPVVEDQSLNAVTKLQRILDIHNRAYDDRKNINDFFHRAENALAHHKHLIREIQVTAPILARVLEQGTREGAFDTRYPKEIGELMIFALAFLVNPFAIQGNQQDQASRFKALQEVLERALGASSGTLSFLHTLLRIGQGEAS